MSTYHTVDGQSYAVTAGASDATITDSSGLSRTVKAGTQESFLGDGGDVTVDGPHHFTQLKGPFGNGGGGGGGGGQKITVDDYIDHTYTSLNPVQNRVLAYAIDSKQDKLTIDPAPVAGSANPVASGGVQSCLADKASLAGTNVFTGTNSFNGTVGGSGVKDYADGYAEWSVRTADLPSGTELSGVKYGSGFMPKGLPQPYHLQYITDTLFSDDAAVRADRIRLRVMRGREAFAKPRHHYIVYGRPSYTSTGIPASAVGYKTVKPVSYYDTDWEEDGTKLVEFASTGKDVWWYQYAYYSEVYYAVSNGTDPDDLTNVIVHPVHASSNPANGDVDWAAVYSGYTTPSTGPARASMTPKLYRSNWNLSFFVETTGYKSTKDRIDDAAKKGEANTFTGSNTFNNGVKLGDRYYSDLACDTLNRIGHDLYWGCKKLNGGGGEGYAKLDDYNVFTRQNTFNGSAGFYDGASFHGCTQFYYSTYFLDDTTFKSAAFCSCVSFGGSVDFYSDINVSDGHAINLEPRYSNYCEGTIYNLAGDLYWGRNRVGDVVSNRDNVFNSGNTFNCNTVFNGAAYFHDDVHLVDRGYCVGTGLYNYDGNLYWDGNKLNCQTGGDVYQDGCNAFTGINTFSSDTTFRGVLFNNYGVKVGCSVLYNYDGDLYWGETKLNGGGGGGDVYADRNNVFTGCNTFGGTSIFNGNAFFDTVEFSCGVKFGGTALFTSPVHAYGGIEFTCSVDTLLSARDNGDLYWGETKLNGGGGDVTKAGDNVFTGSNAFNTSVTVYELYFGSSHISAQTGPYLYTLTESMRDRLYWGEDKVALDGADNVFTGSNEFTSSAVFSGQAEFTSAASFSGTPALNAGAVLPNPGTDTRQPCTIANYNGDLYWGTCKLNSQSVTVDTYPVMGSTNPVSSGGMYPTPVLVVQGGTAQFPSRLRDNGIYVLWDNDLADRSAEIVIDPDTRPNEYSTAEIHIFNHTDTPVSIKWPASWHWRTPEGDYELDTEASQHVPVLKGNSCMCITVRCSVDRGTHFTPPPMTIVPFVMAEKAYEYTLSENTQQEG